VFFREELGMKLTHLSAGAMASMILLSAPAKAQTYDPAYPVCLQVYQGFVDYYFECAYQTMGQCQASASGRSASCVVNPYYAGPKGKRSKKKPRPVGY
jgi:uncharacterized protein DUF3551